MSYSNPTQKIMTVLEVIEFCENSDAEFSYYPDEEFFREFEIDEWDVDRSFYSDIDSRLKIKPFDTWECWDTPVGKSLLYFDDDPVAIIYRPYRKSEEQFYWINDGDNHFENVKNYVESFIQNTYNYNEVGVDEKIAIESIEIGDSRSWRKYAKDQNKVS